MIGDSLDHDILGGRGVGILTLLITSGIHREALVGAIDLAREHPALGGIRGADAALGDRPSGLVSNLVW